MLQSGFHPDFFLSHSFFTGQSHLLILAGLALDSSQLAMGLLFLGGVLSAVAAASLVRRWTNRQWALTAALTFLLTPVVFWQISSAGAPDMWMAFFVTVGVLVISRSHNSPSASQALLSGALAGAVAGAKYTGCIIAASMAVAYLWESRSLRKLLLFFLGSLISGVWPYARNFVWTGDPMFPFLLRHLSPGKINGYTLASCLADTGAGQHITFPQILKFPFFAAIDPQHMGFWQFLGPLILCFAPLLILAARNTAAWRVTLIVWMLGALGTGFSSGMSRFLLPLLPSALAGTFAGVSQLAGRGWRTARYISAATIGSFFLFGAVGLLFYDRAALLVAAGIAKRDEYMRARVPEYEITEFVNRVLSGKEAGGKTLVFMRDVFYLRIPLLYGDPYASWAVDPSKLHTPEEWRAFFQTHNIRWVVRSPEYPPSIAAPLIQLETTRQLSPIARTETSDFQGSRVFGQRQSVVVTILQVND
jgi:MFS family permease